MRGCGFCGASKGRKTIIHILTRKVLDNGLVGCLAKNNQKGHDLIASS
jgi:hypothetical protein